MGPTALWVGRPALCLLVSFGFFGSSMPHIRCRCAAGSTPLRRTRPSIIDQRSSINDQRSIGGLSAAFATAPVISGAGRMQMQVLICNFSAGSKSPPMQAGSSSPPMHCSCWEPQKLGDRLNRESSVSDRRSWSSVFCIFLLFNCVFDFGQKSQVILTSCN